MAICCSLLSGEKQTFTWARVLYKPHSCKGTDGRVGPEGQFRLQHPIPAAAEGLPAEQEVVISSMVMVLGGWVLAGVGVSGCQNPSKAPT